MATSGARRVRANERLNLSQLVVSRLDLCDDSDLAWVDRHPHEERVHLVLPEHAPRWADTYTVRFHNGEYTIRVPKRILNRGTLEAGTPVRFEESGEGRFTLLPRE